MFVEPWGEATVVGWGSIDRSSGHLWEGVAFRLYTALSQVV